MNPQQLRQLLEAVAGGDLSPDQALADLAELPYADLGFAKLDLHRELRNGLPEAVYAEGKTIGDLRAIVDRMMSAHGRVLLTRLRPEAAETLLIDHPEATYHERARILTCGEPQDADPRPEVAAGNGDPDLEPRRGHPPSLGEGRGIRDASCA